MKNQSAAGLGGRKDPFAEDELAAQKCGTQVSRRQGCGAGARGAAKKAAPGALVSTGQEGE